MLRPDDRTEEQTTMKAVTYDRYCSPADLLLADVAKPTIGEGEAGVVVVRVRAASLNPADWHLLTGTPYIARLDAGVRGPKRSVLGMDLAGTVEAVGPGVSAFEPGDDVFGWVDGGACASYAAVPAAQLVMKPPNVSFEQAAATGVAAFTALQGLRDKGRLRAGQSVIINGASGGIGTFAVQIAKALGAEVTAVCSTANVERLRALGADHVIDYRRDDFAERGGRYDMMLDNVGNRSLADCRKVLTTKGSYVMVSGPKGPLLGPIPRLVRTIALSSFVSQRLIGFVSKETLEDLRVLRELLATGDVTPVIDSTYPLANTAEALGHLADGHATGKVIVVP